MKGLTSFSNPDSKMKLGGPVLPPDKRSKRGPGSVSTSSETRVLKLPPKHLRGKKKGKLLKSSIAVKGTGR